MRIIIYILIVTLLSACVKSGDGPNYPIFTGITNTDIIGSIIGYEDPTDWKLDDFWLPCNNNCKHCPFKKEQKEKKNDKF